MKTQLAKKSFFLKHKNQKYSEMETKIKNGSYKKRCFWDLGFLFLEL